jgi:hypothetical protein
MLLVDERDAVEQKLVESLRRTVDVPQPVCQICRRGARDSALRECGHTMCTACSDNAVMAKACGICGAAVAGAPLRVVL